MAPRGRLLLGASLPALSLAAAALLPAARPVPFEVCPLHLLTGLPCLTCGLTRSVCSIVQGDPMTGLSLHPAGGLVVLLLGLHALWRVFEAARGRALGRRALASITAVCAAAGGILSAGAWIVRLSQA